jgi:glycosyltransferase involved in cell wall biosynthesis
MKILVLCYEYPPIGGGGGRVAKSVAEKLSQRGHDVHVQTAGMPHLPKLERVNGVIVHRAPSFRRREDRCTVPEMALFLVTGFLPTLRHLREWRPDVIHAHFAVPTGALAFAISFFARVPYVLTVHLGDVPGGFPDQTDQLFRIVKPLTVPIWRRAAAVSAVSGHVRELAVKAYGMPVKTILNGIEIPSTLPAPSRSHTPRRILFVGRFVSQKNVLVIIEALARLRELDWHATLIGDGPLMPEVRGRVRAHGFDQRVTVPGWQESAAVECAMIESDIFLIPSSAEGLPVAAIQALRHGLAIIGTDIGGLREVIDPERNGFVVPVGDADALAAKLRVLLEDEPILLAMKGASRKRANLFDLDAIAMQYENLLRTAVERVRGTPAHHAS